MATATDYLIESLANSATLQAFVGATGPDLVLSAKAKIYLDALPITDEPKTFVPFVWIHEGGGSYELEAVASFNGSGEIIFQLWERRPDNIAQDYPARTRRMRDTMKAVIEEVLAQVQTGGRLCDIRRVRYMAPQHQEPSEIESKGDLSWIQATVEWSQGGEG